MTNEQIKEIALKNGFKLKEQPNGEMDLNPYVYDFARALLSQKLNKLQDDIKCVEVNDPYDTVASRATIDSVDDVIERHIDDIWSK